MTALRELQQRFQAYLVDGNEAIEQDIVSTADALAEHRLGTYYNAYRIRLIDALAVDFSALEKFLGRETFENLVLDYLHRYPSTTASLRWVGRHFPTWLEQHYGGDDAELVRELGAWEWAQASVFDAADSPLRVQLDDMAAYPPHSWPGLIFRFKPALAWLDLHWNVPQIEAALDNDEAAPRPQRNEYPQRWLLWRRDYKTHWRSLDVHEAWALQRAIEGASFADVCEGLLEWVDAEQVSLVAAGLLKQWISDQLLLQVDEIAH